MYIVRAHSLWKWGGLLPKVLIFWKVQLFPRCGKWKRWRFNSKSLWVSSHIWNLAWNLPLNVTRSSQNEWRVLNMFLLLFAHKPSFTRNHGNTFEKVLFARCFCSVKKKTSPCRNRCVTKQLRWKPSRSWRTARGRKSTAGDQAKMRRRKKSYRENPENARKKQRNPLQVEQKNSKKRWNDTSQS